MNVEARFRLVMSNITKEPGSEQDISKNIEVSLPGENIREVPDSPMTVPCLFLVFFIIIFIIALVVPEDFPDDEDDYAPEEGINVNYEMEEVITGINPLLPTETVPVNTRNCSGLYLDTTTPPFPPPPPPLPLPQSPPHPPPPPSTPCQSRAMSLW